MDPTVYSGDAFWERLDTLSLAVNEQSNARLPGAQKNDVSEVSISKALWETVLKLATA